MSETFLTKDFFDGKTVIFIILQSFLLKRDAMSTELIKKRLYLRIEQADEKLLRVLDQFSETLFEEYHHGEGKELSDEEIMALPAPPWAKPLTKEESIADLRAALVEYEGGEYVTLDELDQEAEKW